MIPVQLKTVGDVCNLNGQTLMVYSPARVKFCAGWKLTLSSEPGLNKGLKNKTTVSGVFAFLTPRDLEHRVTYFLKT